MVSGYRDVLWYFSLFRVFCTHIILSEWVGISQESYLRGWKLKTGSDQGFCSHHQIRKCSGKGIVSGGEREELIAHDVITAVPPVHMGWSFYSLQR